MEEAWGQLFSSRDLVSPFTYETYYWIISIKKKYEARSCQKVEMAVTALRIPIFTAHTCERGENNQ